MASEQEFALEERKIGKKVHYHNSTWWVQTAPLYCKPIHEFRPFPPGAARPSLLYSLGGYSHQVPDKVHGNRSVRWMVLQGEDLHGYSLDRLPANKRRTIRNGLRNCQFRVLSPSNDVREEMRQINISQAHRFREGGEVGSYLPASFYDTHAEKWWETIKSLLSHKGHRFWGAFLDNVLVAYADVIQIEDTWIMGAVKSHSDYLAARPVDGLYYSILEAAGKDNSCLRVVNGGPDGVRGSLNAFKELFLFRSVEMPYFSRSLIGIEKAKSLLSLQLYFYRLTRNTKGV